MVEFFSSAVHFLIDSPLLASYIEDMTTTGATKGSKMYELSEAGATNEGRAFDVYTRNGRFVGLVVETYGKHTKLYYNDTATRGSARKFASIGAAVDFMHNRRITRGMPVD